MPDSPNTAAAIIERYQRLCSRLVEFAESGAPFNYPAGSLQQLRELLLGYSNSERAEAVEDLGQCELCDKPLTLGQFVNQYDDLGTAHANCEAPFTKPTEETPAPADDGSTMSTYVLLGVPALLERIAQ